MKTKNGHTVDLLFVITLFFLFAISSLAMIAVGAKVYQNSVDHMNENAANRTAYLYFTEKLHQNDATDSVSIGTFDGAQALVLSKDANGDTYNTYLYLYNDQLCELTVKEGNESSVEAAGGQKVLELSDFSVEWASDNLLHFSVTRTDGESEDFLVFLHAN